MQENKINAGDIVIAQFPTWDGAPAKWRPCLVVLVEDSLSGESYARLAYGSSRQVSKSGHLKTEFILYENELEGTGLTVPTRFNFALECRMNVRCCHKIGNVNLRCNEISSRLKAALAESM